VKNKIMLGVVAVLLICAGLTYFIIQDDTKPNTSNHTDDNNYIAHIPNGNDAHAIALDENNPMIDTIPEDAIKVNVLKMIDPITFISTENEKYTLAGVDQSNSLSSENIAEAFSGGKVQDLVEFLLEDKIAYVIPLEKDNEGRTLGYVWRGDGVFVNLQLIRQGFCTVAIETALLKPQMTVSRGRIT
jgi:hypothetical protein